MKAHWCKGFSIVELMVALAIGILILSGVVQTLANSKRNSVDQEELAFMQENARFALDLLARDIRMAGYMGCASEETAQVANSVEGSSPAVSSLPVEGLEGGASGDTGDTFPAYINNPKPFTDAFTVRRADESTAWAVKDHTPPNSAVIDIHGGIDDFELGDTLMLVDLNCRQVGIFHLSHLPPSGKLGHNTGGNGSNCSKFLGGSYSCPEDCSAGNCAEPYSYSPGSVVMKFVANTYFVADSTVVPGLPALKREVLANNGGTREEELVAGVEDLEAVYGVDADDDGEIDHYLDADEVVTANWPLVRAVRFSLTLRSQSEILAQAQTVTINGATYNDRYLRQGVTTTVKLRNRG